MYAHLSHTQFVLLTPVMQKSPKYISNKMVCHCQIYSDFSHKVTTLPKLHFNMSSIYSTQRKSKVWGMNSALLCLLCPMKVVHHSKRLWQSFSKINFVLKDFLLLLCQSVGKPANSERQTRGKRLMLRKSVNSCSVTFVKESKGSIFIHVPIIELNKNYSWFLLHKRLHVFCSWWI